MTTLQTEKPEAPSCSSSNPIKLKLDIFTGDQWTHSLDLPAGKCTIGSSPSCQIRLPEGQVRPLHCLLVSNEEGISATSWAPGVLLNEQEFSSAPVYAGDVLSIGNLQLKLTLTDSHGSDYCKQDTEGDSDLIEAFEDQGPTSDPHPSHSAESSNTVELNELPSDNQDEASEGNYLKTTIASQQARARCRRIIKGLRSERVQLANSQQKAAVHADRMQAAVHERDLLADELEKLRNSSAGEILDLTERLQASEGERETISTALEQLQIRSQSEASSFVDQIQALQSDRDHLTSELDQLRIDNAEQTHSLTEQLQTANRELERHTAELQQSQAHAQNEARSLADQIQAAQSERDTLTAELDHVRNENAEHTQSITEQLQAANSERERLSAELEQLQVRAQTEANSFANKIQALQSERETLAAELDHERGENAQQTQGLTEQLQAANCERERLSTELEQLHTNLADRDAHHSAEVDRILGELAEAYDKSNHTDAVLQETQVQCSELQLRIDEIAAEREQLMENYRTIENEKAQATEALTERDARLRDIELELQVAKDAAQGAEDKLAEQYHIREELSSELNSVRDNHAESAAEIDRLKCEYAEMQHDFPALQEKLQANETSLLASNEQIERLNSELDSLHSELDALRSERDQLTTEKENLTTENAEQRNRNELLVIDVKSLKNEWQQAHADVARLKEARLAAESRVEQLKAENAEFDKEAFEAVSSERTQLSEQVQSLRGDLTAREEVLQASEARLEELQAIVFQSEVEQASLTEELASRVGQIEHLSRELESVKEDVAKHTEERNLFEEQCNDHEKTIEELRSQIDELKSNITQVEQERNETALTFTTQEAKYAELKEEFEAQRTNASQREAEWEQYSLELSDKESQIAQLTNELDIFRSRISEVEQERDEISARIATQELHIANLSEELESVRSKESTLEEEHEEYAQCIATQVDQIEQLTLQLDSIREKVSLVEQERDHVTDRLASRDADVEKLSADLDESRELLADCAQQAQDVKTAYEATLEELEQARGSNQATPTYGVEEVNVEPLSDAEDFMEDTSSDKEREVTETVVLLNGAADLADDVEEDRHEVAKPDFQPTSFIDKYSHLLDENHQGQEENLLETLSTPAVRSPEIAPPSEALYGEGDDGDLEAYMSSLMKRVRGDSTSDSSSQQARKECETNANRDSSNLNVGKNSYDKEVKETTAISSPEHLGLLDMAELKANCTGTAQPIDLAAMRELANSSARSAIAKHRKQRHFEGALGKFLVTAAAGVTAASMILSADNYFHPLFLGGCAVGVISVIWGLKLAGTFLEMIRDGGDKTEVISAGIADERDSLPIDGSVDLPNQRSAD
ncbi:FHA domain-containing protein [Bythopirellula polymerisocia]|uniref:Chromosome segregation protein n=1 Tax=Bythopirellula polymerisocia TaxID=2528003 RepID=A0A5C6CIP5_9BACT|nr:FHA domain-containing protein [Bythopirellula polymerisocia]TWU24653.1 chromosome segregation protein [Bythopirellula polymerisocia]